MVRGLRVSASGPSHLDGSVLFLTLIYLAALSLRCRTFVTTCIFTVACRVF